MNAKTFCFLGCLHCGLAADPGQQLPDVPVPHREHAHVLAATDDPKELQPKGSQLQPDCNAVFSVVNFDGFKKHA